MKSKVSRYFDYFLEESKKDFIFEAKSDKSASDKSKATEYDINSKINIDKSTNLSYKTYVTLFVEALNSLDAMAAIATGIDPNYGPAKSYSSDRYKVALIDQSTPEGLKGVWDKMLNIAGGPGKGLYAVVQTEVLKNDAVKKYQEEKQKLDDQKSGKSGRQITDEYYSQELNKLKEKYSSLIDPAQTISLSKLVKALAYYSKAIEKFREGANSELAYVEKSGADLDSFCGKVSDAISNIVLSKNPDSKKQESYNYIHNVQHVLNEDFGGFLKKSKDFATGVVKPKSFTKDDKAESTDKASIISAAENLKGSLISAASEIDNVINFKKNISGESEGQNEMGDKASKETAEEAKSGAAEMISFIQDSFKYVVDINKELENSGVTLKSIKSKLDDIAAKLKIYRRPGGPLDQWKNDVLGESTKGQGRGRIVSTANLQKGRELMSIASGLVAEVSKAQSLKKEIKSQEAGAIFKKAYDAFTGKSSEEGKTSRVKTKGDIKTFPKSGDQDKEVVKEFQQRLIDLGHLPKGTPSGTYDKETEKASKIAMQHVATVSGKIYDDSDQAFLDFQKDLGIYASKKDVIRKNLGF